MVSGIRERERGKDEAKRLKKNSEYYYLSKTDSGLKLAV